MNDDRSDMPKQSLCACSAASAIVSARIVELASREKPSERGLRILWLHVWSCLNTKIGWVGIATIPTLRVLHREQPWLSGLALSWVMQIHFQESCDIPTGHSHFTGCLIQVLDMPGPAFCQDLGHGGLKTSFDPMTPTPPAPALAR